MRSVLIRRPPCFRDEGAISIADGEHGGDEERWVTMGMDASGRLVVAVHIFEELDGSLCRVRLISARRATKKEASQYAGLKR